MHSARLVVKGRSFHRAFLNRYSCPNSLVSKCFAIWETGTSISFFLIQYLKLWRILGTNYWPVTFKTDDLRFWMFIFGECVAVTFASFKIEIWCWICNLLARPIATKKAKSLFCHKVLVLQHFWWDIICLLLRERWTKNCYRSMPIN